MIESIEELKDFGIYKSFRKNSQLHNFSKYNLFYGWNGSGKSTLSKLFALLGKGEIPEVFQKSQFKVALNGGRIVKHDDFESAGLKVCVFNQDFINENIDWNKSMKSLLLVSEERIDDHKRLLSLNDQKKELTQQLDAIKVETEKRRNEIDGFLSSTAKKIKLQFQSIDTQDKYYFNYNKTKLEQLIETADKSMLSNLSIDEVNQLTKAIQPNIKEEIEQINIVLSRELHLEAKSRLDTLLKTSIISHSIERLKLNADISVWVEKGLEIHKKHNSNVCEFCGESVSESQILRLENHFNDEYKLLKDRLNKAVQWLSDQLIDISNFPPSSYLYDELHTAYISSIETFKSVSSQINSVYQTWLGKLTEKINNPFSEFQIESEIPEHDISQLNQTILEINNLIVTHNNKTKNFKIETDLQKKKLETHFMFKSIEDFNFFGKMNAQKKNLTKKRELELNQKIINEEIEKVEITLSNEVLGASVFNEQIHKFLGHKEISLKFDQIQKGYTILRHNRPAKNLSEGEKTAVAFVYFIIKLKENGNEINETIVVVDDPISSFDSNNLFHSYSFFREACQDAQQLFILTHNFIYYKLIRDWLKNKNKNNRPVKSSFFSIESVFSQENQRESIIKNANDALLSYNSEYHYLFYKVYGYKDLRELSVDESYVVANLSRKLLEGFLSFKFPKKRNDFKRLMEDAIKDVTTCEKIYKFINKYSHNMTIEVDDNTIDNLIGESQNIVKEILQVIKSLDSDHYQELESIMQESDAS
jgi:Uncharacterized protein conserved in bacteria